MNYIRQAEGFADYCRDHRKQISEKGRLLWYALFHILNRRFWPQGSVTISKYELLALFPASEDSLRRASAELAQLGLITFEAETRSSDARYGMTPLYEEEENLEELPAAAPQDAGKVAPDLRETCGESAENLRESCADEGAQPECAGRILSIDRARARTGENENPNAFSNEKPTEKAVVDEAPSAAARDAPVEFGDNAGRVYALAKECGFALTKRSRGWLGELVNTYGAAWVCEAIERSARRGKCTIGYIQGILASWKTAGGIDDAGAKAPARAACEKSKNFWGHFKEERTYTKEEDEKLYWDPFKEEA